MNGAITKYLLKPKIFIFQLTKPRYIYLMFFKSSEAWDRSDFKTCDGPAETLGCKELPQTTVGGAAIVVSFREMSMSFLPYH